MYAICMLIRILFWYQSLPFMSNRHTCSPLVCLQRLADNFGMVNYSVPKFLNIVDFAHRLVGPKPLEFLSSALNKASQNYIPEWNKYMPRVSFWPVSAK